MLDRGVLRLGPEDSPPVGLLGFELPIDLGGERNAASAIAMPFPEWRDFRKDIGETPIGVWPGVMEE